MTPFQHLCGSDVTFLEDRNFYSSLVIWWYGCMSPQTEDGKKRKHGRSYFDAPASNYGTMTGAQAMDDPVVQLDDMMDNMMLGQIATLLT